MERRVMRGAKCYEIFSRVFAAFGARLEMVHIDVSRVATARHSAAPAVPAQDLAPERGRDGLLRTRGLPARVHVGVDALLCTRGLHVCTHRGVRGRFARVNRSSAS